MEITLSDKDLEALAGMLERRITDRVVGRVMSNPLWDGMTERAKMFALAHFSDDAFTHSAVDAMRRHLADEGAQTLDRMIRAAVAQVHADDPELSRAIRKGIYEAALRHAERFKPSDDDNNN